MNIQTIYNRYHLMPSLQLHMMRVAAVAQLLSEHMTVEVSKNDVIAACLLHDLANIIKFDLTKFSEFLEPKGLAYWQKNQRKMIEVYGTDEHQATLAMLKELNVSPQVFELVAAIGFGTGPEIAAGDNIGKKICEYADCRVAPTGIVSVAERLQDFEVRYGQRYPSVEDVARRRVFATAIQKIEQDLFVHTTLKPEEINDATARPLLPHLRTFDIPTN